LSPGKTVTTNTGRKTTPFPEVKTGKINSWKTVKNIDKWVVQNAVDEAVSRGDVFNKRQFEQDLGRKNIPMASTEMAVDYLFGDYIPPAIKSPLKDMVSPKAESPKTLTPADILKNAAQQGVKGLDEVTKGLYELFGGGALKSGVGGFDAETYAKAKPHFEAGFQSFVAAGKSMKDFVRWVVDSFGKAAKPYLVHWAGDKKSGLTTDEKGPNIDSEGGDKDESEQIRTNAEGLSEGSGTEEIPANDQGEIPDAVLPGTGGGRVPGEGKPGSSRDEGRRGERDSDQRPADYTITNADGLGKGGPKQKYRDNLAAIRLIKSIGDRQATPEEQSILVKYVGWGGLPQAFPRPDGSIATGWDSEVNELRDLLSDEEYASARRSTQDAHYTSQTIIKGVYSALKRFGFKRGKILEPSVGTGNFIGLMPKGVRSKSHITGIELEPITAAIAKQLYPEQRILQSGFQDIFIAPGSFDAAVGNPPFGDQKLFDSENTDLRKFSIHNFFFAKSLKGLRENGILAMVVSSSMMDKVGTAQRAWLNKHAELIGAIRLPNNAFKENALTDVTTDIIFLRKRAEGEQEGENLTGAAWLNLAEIPGDEHAWRVNEYFAEHPEMMLGDLAPNKLHPAEIVDGVYDAVPGMIARKGVDLGKALTEAVERLPEGIFKTGKTVEEVQAPDIIVSDPGFAQPYGYTLDDSGRAVRRLPDRNGEQRYELATYGGQPLSGNRLERFKALLQLRDDIRKLIRAEVSDNPKMDVYRKHLNKHYDAFVEKYGYISAQVNSTILKHDPTDLPLLRSLEKDYNKGTTEAESKKTGTPVSGPSAGKSAIFTKRTRMPYVEATHAETVKDGLAISLRERGVVDVDHIAKLTGKPETEVVKGLEGLAFLDPDSDTWEAADVYLSGNVKKKLKAAESAAGGDDAYKVNVEALKKVIPEDVPPDLIHFRVGASWFPTDFYEDFAQEKLGSDMDVRHLEDLGVWVTRINNNGTSEFDTDQVSGAYIFNRMVKGQDVLVYAKDDKGTRYVDRDASAAAQERGTAIDRAFQDWVLSDGKRRDILAKNFNDKINVDVKPKFDGSHMIFPGMGIINAGVERDDQMRTHQKSAIWRLIQKGFGLLDHVVGSGKTFAAIATGLELKRMGLVKKPMYVVPNHLVPQWTEDFQKLYPGANVLAISRDDFSKANRQEFLARIATGDWDAVLIAHSSFGFIRMPSDYEMRFYQEQLDQLEEAMKEMAEEGGSRMTVKQMEKTRDRMRARMDELANRPIDAVVDFSELGVDAVF
ncbi:MAG: DEAD/DEAH box helicase family protein, partial [Desulfobacterales bacterium]|nr:DEAD/DEAH box helicase family protein [Desulfobacterales bacterium]